MNNSILIKNGRVIDPIRKIDGTASMLVAGENIVWSGGRADSIPGGEWEEIDAKGMIVCPGFIDLHCHLREPGYEDKETIASGTRAAAKGGFTTVCCMPNTNPPLNDAPSIINIKQLALRNAVVNVLPIGCISKDRKGREIADLDQMSKAGAAGFSDDGSPVVEEAVLKDALRKSVAMDKPVIEHCEDPKTAGTWDMNQGVIAQKLGLRGMPAGSEESIIERDLSLNKSIGGKLHIAHVSTQDSVMLIRKARQQGVRVTAEATPHHLILTEDRVVQCGTNAKVNPPLRTLKDVEAIAAGLQDGTIDIIATDHAPHTFGDKEQPFSRAAFGFSGFETALGSLLKLVSRYGLSVNLIIEKLTSGPAALIGKSFPVPPVLAEGAPADLVVFAPDTQWKVNVDDFLSKGKNTPLAGETLTGKVVLTMYHGKIVFCDTTHSR